jgi:hypothetical protein
MDTEAVRQLINDDPRPHHAYSSEVRRAVGRYAKRRREEGARWCDIEQELGISSTSARKWMLALGTGGFQQVVVVEPPVKPSTAELVIISPAGFSLTGCSLEEAVAVMQRLR